MNILLWREAPRDTYQEDDSGIRTHVRRFFCKVSSGMMRPRTLIRSAQQCPRRYDPHPDDKEALANLIRVDRSGPGNRLFDIEVEYTTDLSNFENEEEQHTDPLDRAVKYSVSGVIYQEQALFDLDGKPFTTTTGELITDLSNTEGGCVLRGKLNTNGIPNWLIEGQSGINTTAVTVHGRRFPKHTLKFLNPQMEEEKYHATTSGLTVYYPTTYELHYRRSGWKRPVPNRGFYQKLTRKYKDEQGKEQTQTYVERISPGGVESTSPLFLDEQGKWIEEPTPENIFYLDFKREHEFNFRLFPGVK